jgi:YfiH family protein
MAELFELDSRGLYRCAPFENFSWQQHGFGTRLVSPPSDLTLRQIHSSRVWNARGLRDRQEEGDALVTDQPGLAIAVRTADCLPILLLDPHRKAVAAIHSGWRGTAAEIVCHTVSTMSRDFGSDPADLYAALGPSIRACCYEVGPDVAAHFAALFPEWEAVLPSPAGKRHIDLAEANRRLLASVGLSPGRIFDSGLCTACLRAQFFSFRIEPANPGRLLSSIRLI